MTDLIALKAANELRWANAKLTRNFTGVAKRLIASEPKARYQAVSVKTGVPWPFLAVAHERESSQDWNRSLAQGDPWSRVSVHVPAGRGPFRSWGDAAIDALVNCSPHAARNKDWSIGGTLTMLEEYNGLGYLVAGLLLTFGQEQIRINPANLCATGFTIPMSLTASLAAPVC